MACWTAMNWPGSTVVPGSRSASAASAEVSPTNK
jgi:hypothetical protein